MNKTRKNNNKINNKTLKNNSILSNIYRMNLKSSAFNNINYNKNKNSLNNFNEEYEDNKNNKPIVYINSDNYKFIMYQEEDDMNYILFFMANNPNIKDSCLKIYIPKENAVDGLIEKLNHEKSCSIEKELDEGNGTIHMLKTALKYIIDNYPNTKYFQLTDITFKKIPGLPSKDLPYITAKRLLQGSKGWYQEHFGAKPTRKTKLLIDMIKIKRNRIDELIASNINNTLWSAAKIKKIASRIDGKFLEKNILETDWIIDYTTIKGYNINYEISTNDNYKNYKNIINVLNNAYNYNIDINN